jgi:hypothetical protein
MHKDVFVLGAGFSKAISQDMPILSELSDSIHHKLDGKFLANEMPPSEMTENIEMLLSYLSQDYPWLNEAQKLRNRAAFIELSDVIAKDLSSREAKIEIDKLPQWLPLLVKTWHERQVDVITFNYDTLIERIAEKIQAQIVGAELGKISELNHNDLYPVTIPSAASRGRALISGSEHMTFNLYKMHGSTDWYYSGNNEFFGEVIYRQSANDPKFLGDIIDKVPLIIPPTFDKTFFFKNETIRKIWQVAWNKLNEAQRIFCLGYSFPVTDMLVRFFTLTNITNHKVCFYWVNICQHKEELKTMLPKSWKINPSFVRNDAIEAFANFYVNEGLESLKD